jgi:hypothetical protein
MFEASKEKCSSFKIILSSPMFMANIDEFESNSIILEKMGRDISMSAYACPIHIPSSY